jgi:hypothetical protein
VARAGKALALLAVLAGCTVPGEERLPPSAFEAKVGSSCTPCETCTTAVQSCECRTCTHYARDLATKQLLVCTSSGWTFYRDCPGGVSVACADDFGYRLQCLGADGKSVL